MFIRCRRSL